MGVGVGGGGVRSCGDGGVGGNSQLLSHQAQHVAGIYKQDILFILVTPQQMSMFLNCR